MERARFHKQPPKSIVVSSGFGWEGVPVFPILAALTGPGPVEAVVMRAKGVVCSVETVVSRVDNLVR